MALKFFAEQKCDLVILETGLGGRLDATNIVTPLASIITNIAFDHEQWLGDTLAKIAAEKAGIIKPGVPVITATDAPDALLVIEQMAREKNAPLTPIQPAHASRLTPHASLLGEHQKLNAALALATVEVLQKQIPVAEEKIRAGLAGVNWPGRLQLIEKSDGQKILLDGAHNVAGAETLRAALETNFAGTRPAIIFGALQDKQWPDICRLLAPLAPKFFTVPVASERTADARALANCFRAANPAAEVAVVENLPAAIIASKDEPFIVVTGSLYLVGEALERLGFPPATGGERGLNEWAAPQIQ
jgi:dihydrofolate synthase/folylpolyglutamate synthase